MHFEPASAAHGDLVLVRVRTAGELHRDRPGVGFAGIGFAGVVESVGRNVTAFAPGDEVIGIGDVAFGGYVCTTQDRIQLTPHTGETS